MSMLLIANESLSEYSEDFIVKGITKTNNIAFSSLEIGENLAVTHVKANFEPVKLLFAFSFEDSDICIAAANSIAETAIIILEDTYILDDFQMYSNAMSTQRIVISQKNIDFIGLAFGLFLAITFSIIIDLVSNKIVDYDDIDLDNKVAVIKDANQLITFLYENDTRLLILYFKENLIDSRNIFEGFRKLHPNDFAFIEKIDSSTSMRFVFVDIENISYDEIHNFPGKAFLLIWQAKTSYDSIVNANCKSIANNIIFKCLPFYKLILYPFFQRINGRRYEK